VRCEIELTKDYFSDNVLAYYGAEASPFKAVKERLE